jgi:hypothetical protein
MLFHTDYVAEKVKFDVKDGKAIIDNKEFIIDRTTPILLKETRLGRTRFKPFYLMKWNQIEPANLQVVDIEPNSEEYAELAQNSFPVIRTLEVIFPEKGEGDVLPEMLRETHDMRYMKHLKKYASEGAGGGRFKFKFSRWMVVPFALIVSAIAMFFIQGGRFF